MSESGVVSMQFPSGHRLALDFGRAWHLTTELVEADGAVAHAVATAANLRLALRGHDGTTELELDERQAAAVLAVLPAEQRARAA